MLALLECRANRGDIVAKDKTPVARTAVVVRCNRFPDRGSHLGLDGQTHGQLGAVRLVRTIEKHIASLVPRWALVTFLLPSLILIPAKLLGLHAITSGHLFLGSTVFILAKLLGMALFSRIFNLTCPALMQLAWFARLYAFVMYYRNRIHAYLDNWPAYQRIKLGIRVLIDRIKASFKRQP